MKILNLGCILTLFMMIRCSFSSSDVGLSLEQRCAKYGYQYEEHNVTTSDGYILTIHRVPGLIGEDTTNKPPMYMSKPFFANYLFFFLGEKETAPGYYLSKNGFDVWSISLRGTEWSSRHQNYTTDDKEFWDYTATDHRFDHMAAIEYIIQATAFPQVYTFGISTGGESLAFALALEPEFFEPRVKLFHSVTSTVMLANTRNPIISALANYPSLIDIIWVPGTGELGMPNPFANIIFGLACSSFNPLCSTRENIIYAETHVSNRDTSAFIDQIILETDKFSDNAYKHLFQSAKTGKVTEFDFGPSKNLQKYHQVTPPSIPLSNIPCPVKIYQGNLDQTSDIKDSEWFAHQLNPKKYLGMNLYDLDHVAFFIGKNMHVYLDDIIRISEENPIRV